MKVIRSTLKVLIQSNDTDSAAACPCCKHTFMLQTLALDDLQHSLHNATAFLVDANYDN